MQRDVWNKGDYEMTKAQTHQVIVNENDSWETPPDKLEEAMIKYDVNPVIDVCASFENKKFKRYFSPHVNALNQEWTEDFFMNPPYSEITLWMKKAWEEHKKYNVNALILVFAKTSVKWWHEYVEGKGEVHFQKGRIRFLLNGIESRYCTRCKIRFTENISHCKNCNYSIGKSSPTYDSAWVIFRKEEK